MKAVRRLGGVFLCAVPVFVGAQVAGAQRPSDKRPVPAADVIQLRTGAVDTATRPNLARQHPGQFDPGAHYVVQFDGPVTAEQRVRLEAAGVELQGYLSDFAHVARLDRARPVDVAAEPGIRWVGAYEDAWKIDPQIGQRLIPFQTPERMLIDAAGQRQLLITLFQDEDLDNAMEEIARTGAEVIGGTEYGRHGFVDLIADSDAIENLARLAAVQYIEEAPEAVLRNDTTRWIIQSNVLNQTTIWNQGIRGENQIGGVIDGPVKESHCVFDDTVPPGPSHRKIVLYNGSIGSDTHGTHVAGTMCGDQPPYNVADQFDGMAFAARMTFSPVSPIYGSPSTFISRLTDAHNAGARVHTNSWGDDGTTAYTTWCRQIDLFTHDNEDDVVAFAVTNTSTLKTPENAKNVLAVGASQDTPNQNSHCTGGMGPTFDGRRKPEIYAPGCSTQSASAGTTCGWTSLTGTSMASPAIAGMALLARQYFTDGFYPSGAANAADALTPSGALIRAMVLNAGVDMTNVSVGGDNYPNNREGWGRLLLDNSLHFAGETRTLFVADLRHAEGLSTGQFTDYNVEVIDSSEPLRVTLVWSEPPAAINAPPGAITINDLDLEVEAPGSVIYLGNVFNTSTGESVTGGTADAKNTVEQVHLLTPVTGSYRINVGGALVNDGPQGYALVVTGGIQIAPPDCNSNGVPDDEDIAQGTSQDCDGNLRPDECDPDCDSDGTPDACEVEPDCNANGVPDTCDLTQGTSADCNTNGVPDECDIDSGTSTDCNGNGAPDECDPDCDSDGTPDACEGEPDCNGNGTPDSCDIAQGTSQDCNSNGIPDTCDITPPPALVVTPIRVDPPMAIPNNPAVGTHTFNLTDTGNIVDVDVELHIAHTWNGDLVAQISHGGATATLLNRVGQTGGSGDGTNNDGFQVVLDDEAAVNIHVVDSGGGLVTGTYQPDNYTQGPVPASPLSVFDGLDKSGDWTVSLSDYYAASDSGSISFWALHITADVPTPVDDCNANLVPDECEPDCNTNGVADECDITEGTSIDADGNGIPDECEGVAGDGDCDENGTVNLIDFATFAVCFQESQRGQVGADCGCADMDGDGDVDLIDFATFATLFDNG